MRLLLDTHAALWAVAGDRRFTAEAKRAVVAAEQVFVSAVSLWEIAIKHALGRGDMPVSVEVAAKELRAAGFEELAVTWEHAQRVSTLPRHLADPFDRMLVAQALGEPLVLITHDASVAMYSPTFLRL
jgi:PIN domain nuclease of toxin-antitoxin system